MIWSRMIWSAVLAVLVVMPGVLVLAQEGKPEVALAPFEASTQTRAYCYAGNKTRDADAIGGYGGSDNLPKEIPASISAEEGTLSLVAKPDAERAFGKCAGFALYLVNRTGKRVALSAQDSRLDLICEAEDAKGEWKPIEYNPSSWCGNSYHHVYLQDGECWEFAAPRYTGPVVTRLRYRLKVDGETVIHSNVFEGRIQPTQFEGKEGHTPSNVMDPYDE